MTAALRDLLERFDDSLAAEPTSTDTRATSSTGHQGADLVREMRARWQSGEQPSAEEFLNVHPALWQQTEAVVDLAYEEFCLRQAAGQEDAAENILGRFPQWADPLRVMLDCHRLLRSSCEWGAGRDPVQLPQPGDVIGEFRLLETLGSGRRARVFLATQPGLAHRPVVLKITPLDGGEYLSLARLQHTNIVPLHTVVDDPERGIRILCMPYFGRLTLADLLRSLADIPCSARSGRDIVEAIDQLGKSHADFAGAARQLLANVSYVQACCWIVAALADALHFAHERGLVHFDVKPANVLLASDGQPMLLDFHLASPPLRPGGPLPEHLGGTLRYMPPEQQAAMGAFQVGRPAALDGRADIFSLGAVLYEALGGPLPITRDSPSLAIVNQQVSVGLVDIVARCVATRLEDRYTSAACVAADLRRHLTDQPLVGVPNRSLRERWQKWRRRRPSTLRTTALLVGLAGTAALLLAGTFWQLRDRQRQAEAALREGQAQIQNGGQYVEAEHTFERGLTQLRWLPGQGDLQQRLREQVRVARQRQLVQELHALADETRGLFGVQGVPTDQLRSLALKCRALWVKRTQIVVALNLTQDPNASDDLQDVGLFAAHVEVRLAAGTDDPAVGQSNALQIVDEAESLLGPSALLSHERHVLRQALGLSTEAPSDRTPLSRTAREHYSLGRSYLAAGNLPSAAAELEAAVALDPAGRWPNFYFGLCAFRLARFEEAVTAFSVCIGTAPESAACYHNRSLAYAALGRFEQARRDAERGRQLHPQERR